MRPRHFFWGLVVVVGCAHDPFAGQCLDAETSARALAEMEKLVDHDGPVRGAKTELVEDACTRRKYVRGNHRIVLFKRPGRPPTDVQASAVVRRDGAVSPEACLADAERTFERLGFPQMQTLVSRVRSKEDWRWLDPDVGPSKWLECAPRPGPDYYDHLQTFVHEISHDATEGNCLYVVQERTRRCFYGVNELPPAKFARIRPKVHLAAAQELIDWTLDLFLGPESKTSVLKLFEEVNSHAAGTSVRVAAAEKEGKGVIYGNDGQRDLNLLPLFLAQTAAYLVKVKETDPALYTRICGMAKENHANGVALFEAGEQAFEAWRKVAAAPKDPMARVESDLFGIYRKFKAEL